MLSPELLAEIQQMSNTRLVQVMSFLHHFLRNDMPWKGQPVTLETIAAFDAVLKERWEARCREEPAPTPSASKPTPSPPPTWSETLSSFFSSIIFPPEQDEAHDGAGLPDAAAAAQTAATAAHGAEVAHSRADDCTDEDGFEELASGDALDGAAQPGGSVAELTLGSRNAQDSAAPPGVSVGEVTLGGHSASAAGDRGRATGIRQRRAPAAM